MKPIEELLKNLARAEVLEFGLVTNRLPSVNIGGKFEPVDDEAPNTDKLLQMLVTMGGSRYVEGLTDKPVQWTTRLEGVGVIAVAAIMRKDVVQARFTVARRDPPARSATVKLQPAAPAPAPAPAPPKAAPAAAPPPKAVPKPAPSPAPSPSPAKATGPVAAEEWDDDDEPTVQTLSPPVAPPGRRPASPVGDAEVRRPAVAPAPASEARAKPARRPEEVASPAPAAAPLNEGLPRRSTTPTSVDAVEVAMPAAPPPAAPPPPAAAPPPAAPAPAAAPPPAAPAPAAAAPASDALPRADGGLDAFLALASSARASDLHIVAGRPLLARVATELVPRTQPITPEEVERIARDVVPPRLRERLATDGSCDFALDHPKHGRFRVNVSRQRTGFKLSMRVIPREVPTLASLGLPDALASAAKHHQGLVLVTGPTGHGKTSTMAAVVDLINEASAHHVLTVEDPIEYLYPRKRAMISQREVGTHARSFAAALKASLREDPDVIVVGELRDPETVRMAVAASETGHLVIGTMNTPSAAKTVDRLIDLFPPAEQPQVRMSVAGALRLIVGQRLLPSADRTRLHAAVELLPSSIALYTLIRDGRTFQIPSLQQRGRALGVVRLDESLAELVRAQKVTFDAAKQVAESPQELEANLSQKAPVAARRI